MPAIAAQIDRRYGGDERLTPLEREDAERELHEWLAAHESMPRAHAK